MVNYLLTIVGAVALAVGLIAVIDAEVARWDYVNNGEASGCLFTFNCERYN